MKASKSAVSTARRMFRLLNAGGSLDEEKLRHVAKRLAEEKPRDYRGILQTLKRLVEAQIAARTVVVESATALDQGEQDNIVSNLRKKHGDNIIPEFKENSDLLGGLRIKVGDTVYDSSVRSRLNRIAASL